MTDAFTPEEAMIVAGARLVPDGAICFAGIGLPTVAANLARLTHAPGCVLVFESGAMGAKPTRLPRSIADGELARSSDFLVSMPEVFAYFLQGGRIDVGFLGTAQIDRFGNLNTTVIGPYDRPKVRLPGGGGAPEIAAASGRTFVILAHTPRAFVDRLEFRTTVGNGDGPVTRRELGLPGGGVAAVVTDLGVLEPDPETSELILTALHPGATLDAVRAATGWELRVADEIAETAPPTATELAVLRQLQAAGPPAGYRTALDVLREQGLRG